MKLREKDLAPLLEAFRNLPESERKPKLEDPSKATPPKRPVPKPPENGLIIRGYCTYMKNETERAKFFYYKENPDAWAAETQSDMLWLTEAEWKSLIPTNPEPGNEIEVAREIQKRFFSTIGIDYMEGSVNSLPVRDSSMTLTVTKVDANRVEMKLVGEGKMGKEQAPNARTEPRSRGCDLRIKGRVRYERRENRITRFDIAGTGKAWGNKMNYTKNAIRIGQYPWHYGIACELVTGKTPPDLLPPYNLLHYGQAGPYFAKKK